MVNTHLAAQYFFTGEVLDSHGDKLQNVSITVKSSGSTYRTDSFGDFRIISTKADDTLTFSFDGYKHFTTSVMATASLQITLKILSFTAGSMKNQLTSVIKGIKIDNNVSGTDHDAYNSLVENPFVGQSATVSIPGSINLVSYRNIRRFLDMGYMVPPDAVKIEEMLNYFNFYYEEPEMGKIFHCSSDLLSCPWNTAHKLLCLDICARKVDLETAPPGNLTFLIDASGSMDMPNKLPLVKSGFRLLVKNLRDRDTVSIVQFGEKVGVVLEGIPGSKKDEIIRAIEEMVPDGPTPGETGIKLAYKVAQNHFIQGGNNRIILVTDGDISEGIFTENELEDFIEQQKQAGIHLTCVGIGMGSSKYSRLPELAQRGQGNFAYIDDEGDAEKLLVEELAQTNFAVADSMYVTTEFNPALVKAFRLIGFDNKKSVLEDTSFRLKGSKIVSGHSAFALFELVPKDDSTALADSTAAQPIAEIKINYSLPGQNSAQIMSFSCPNKPVPFDMATRNLKKAACIAMFGMKLKESGYASQITWTDIEKMARKTFSSNYFMDKEYIALVAKAKKIYERKKVKSE